MGIFSDKFLYFFANRSGVIYFKYMIKAGCLQDRHEIFWKVFRGAFFAPVLDQAKHLSGAVGYKKHLLVASLASG